MHNEQLTKLLDEIHLLSSSITPHITGGTDAAGTHVESLTEAVMGVTAGLFAIAEAIRESNEK